MKQYEPNLPPTREYVADRDKSHFRKMVWTIILKLNPNLDGELNLAWDFPIDLEGFRKTGAESFGRGVRALQLMNVAIAELEKNRPERDLEPDARWRAAYDLVYGQLLAFRVRVFQYLLAMDNHLKTDPKPKDPKSNHWHRDYRGEMIEHLSGADQSGRRRHEGTRGTAAEGESASTSSSSRSTPARRGLSGRSRSGPGGSESTSPSTTRDPHRNTPEILAKLPKF